MYRNWIKAHSLFPFLSLILLFFLFQGIILYFYIFPSRISNQKNYVGIVALEPHQAHCAVRFIAVGNYSSYKTLHLINKWLANSNNSCSIEIIRENNQFISTIHDTDKLVLKEMGQVPVAQADYMKFLILYYLGGLVTDFDVEPLTYFPWDNVLKGCDVYLGLENRCFHTDCHKHIASSSQIGTMNLYALKARTNFFRGFINYVNDAFFRKSKLNPVMKTWKQVQNISGSGILVEYILSNLSVNFAYVENKDGKSLVNDENALVPINIPFSNGDSEVICFGSNRHYYGLMRHHWEGTWKT